MKYVSPLTFLFLIFSAPLCVQADPTSNAGSAAQYPVGGFDISHFNGEVDWSKVADTKKRFVVLKATEGIDWVDPTFNTHWVAAKKAGLVRGAYHFFVSHDDPAQEAEWYIKNVALEKGDLPPIVDVERAEKTDLTDLAKRLREFVRKLEAHFGEKPIIYTGPNFWNSYIKEPFEDHHLWIADYGVPEPVMPHGWKRWTFWQFTQQASLPGVEKSVDLNSFAGGQAELDRLLLGNNK